MKSQRGRPSEEGRMTLEVATNGFVGNQELSPMSLSHTNLIIAKNSEDAAPLYRDHYELTNVGLEPQA